MTACSTSSARSRRSFSSTTPTTDGRSATHQSLHAAAAAAAVFVVVFKQGSGRSVFIAGIFWGRGSSPLSPKKLTIPPALNLFSAGTCDESQIRHGNILLMDNKHRKLLVIKLPQGCKFMPKMHHNTFGGRRGPAGRAYPLPRPRPVTTYFTFLRQIT